MINVCAFEFFDIYFSTDVSSRIISRYVKFSVKSIGHIRFLIVDVIWNPHELIKTNLYPIKIEYGVVLSKSKTPEAQNLSNPSMIRLLDTKT